MYQVLGIKATLKLFGLACLFMFFLLNVHRLPTLLADWAGLWRAASFAVAVTGGLVVLIGETRAFPWICNNVSCVRHYFPPIEGQWAVTMRSNWGAIQNLMGQASSQPLISKAGTIKVTSRFFRVRLVFRADDNYSTSYSVCVGVRRDPEHGTTQLNYIYHNTTRQPLTTDTSSHNGAARVDVQDNGKTVSLEGVYFTDRKWPEGLNTAGIIRFERAEA